MRRRIRTWTNHAALNLGEAIRLAAGNLGHGAVPPQLNHTDEQLRELAESNPLREFLIGLGVRERSDK